MLSVYRRNAKHVERLTEIPGAIPCRSSEIIGSPIFRPGRTRKIPLLQLVLCTSMTLDRNRMSELRIHRTTPSAKVVLGKKVNETGWKRRYRRECMYVEGQGLCVLWYNDRKIGNWNKANQDPDLCYYTVETWIIEPCAIVCRRAFLIR